MARGGPWQPVLPMLCRSALCCAAAAWLAGAAGCAPSDYRKDADHVAADIIHAKQKEALGHTEPFMIQTPADTLRRRLIAIQDLQTADPASVGSDNLKQPKHWPERDQPARLTDGSQAAPAVTQQAPLKITLLEALEIAARNNRSYQSQKEAVFLSALDLDLALDQFRNTYTGLLESLLISDHTNGVTSNSIDTTADLSLSRRFESGAILTARLALDLSKLLNSNGGTTLGVVADASVRIPLLRGAGREIVAEPLTQAQRNVVYAMWTFERFKRTFAVSVATEYLSVLQDEDTLANAADNYRRLVASGRRARRLADAGRLPQLQVDQARQDELSARASWISANESFDRGLDHFKITLGLPTDSRIALDAEELVRLSALARKTLGELPDTDSQAKPLPADAPIVLDPPSNVGAGPYELEEAKAIRLALDHRLDLLTNRGQVFDAQRQVVVAANALQAGIDLVGTATVRSPNNRSSDIARIGLDPRVGLYTAGVVVDLPWERTAERNVYRESYVRLEKVVRGVQELEDQVKLDIRDALGRLREARESFRIQALAVKLAQRRVDSTNLFLQAGRAEIRDLLDAQASLVTAQNALTAAAVSYRVTELQLQRDMDVLTVNEKGLWLEYEPGKLE
jgi:outer membrane protein TolC